LASVVGSTYTYERASSHMEQKKEFKNYQCALTWYDASWHYGNGTIC